MTDENRRGIAERKQLIETRARMLAVNAVVEGAAWTRSLGSVPIAPHQHERWLSSVLTVAAYRDRYCITSTSAVGGRTENRAQDADRQRAIAAARAAILRAEERIHVTSQSHEIGPSDIRSGATARSIHSRRFD